jgi:hypothetical protein
MTVGICKLDNIFELHLTIYDKEKQQAEQTCQYADFIVETSYLSKA